MTQAAPPPKHSPGALFDTYNRVLRLHGLQPLPEASYKRNQDVMRRFAEFCEGHRIDPERWIRAKHDAIGWRFRVRLTHLTHCSEQFLEKFREWGEGKQAEEQGQERIASQAVPNDPPATGLRVLAERAKGALAGDPEACFVSMDLTFGFDRRSPWCRDCALQDSCREETARVRGG